MERLFQLLAIPDMQNMRTGFLYHTVWRPDVTILTVRTFIHTYRTYIRIPRTAAVRLVYNLHSRPESCVSVEPPFFHRGLAQIAAGRTSFKNLLAQISSLGVAHGGDELRGANRRAPGQPADAWRWKEVCNPDACSAGDQGVKCRSLRRWPSALFFFSFLSTIHLGWKRGLVHSELQSRKSAEISLGGCAAFDSGARCYV